MCSLHLYICHKWQESRYHNLTSYISLNLVLDVAFLWKQRKQQDLTVVLWSITMFFNICVFVFHNLKIVMMTSLQIIQLIFFTKGLTNLLSAQLQLNSRFSNNLHANIFCFMQWINKLYFETAKNELNDQKMNKNGKLIKNLHVTTLFCIYFSIEGLGANTI